MGISLQQFAEALREGVRTEPERFPDLVAEFTAQLQRAYRWPVEQARTRVLKNLACATTMADHDIEREMIIRAVGGLRDPKIYLYTPGEYGPAMKLLAQYVGVKEGSALAGFIFREDIH